MLLTYNNVEKPDGDRDAYSYQHFLEYKKFGFIFIHLTNIISSMFHEQKSLPSSNPLCVFEKKIEIIFRCQQV